MAARNRDRIFVQPLGTSRRLSLAGSTKPSPGMRLGEIEHSGHANPRDEYGWLTQLASGAYVLEQVNGAVRPLDQAKARAAAAYLETLPTEPVAIDLEAVRALLGVPTQVAFADLLGVSGQQYRKLISGVSLPTRTMLRLVDAYRAGYRPADWDGLTIDRRRTSQPTP